MRSNRWVASWSRSWSSRFCRPVQVELSLRIAWLGYGALALLLAGGVWSSDWHFLRALAEWHVLAALILLASFSRLAPLPLLTMAPIWLWTAIVAISP